VNHSRHAQHLAGALAATRARTLSVYAHLGAAEREFPRLAEVNPPRWELGHIGWFQEFWCRRHAADDPAGVRTPSRIAGADALWNSARVPHDARWDLPLPDWDGVLAYVAAVLDDTQEALAAANARDDLYSAELALLHEDMHAEALLMTLQILALPAPPALEAAGAQVAGPAVAMGDLECAGGAFDQGSSPTDAGRRFVWDNERWSHPVTLAPFAIARRCVTQGEFAAFVDAGGYRRTEFWDDDGLAWLAACSRQTPAHWRRSTDRGGGWQQRRFDRWLPLQPDAPMQHVNAHEAAAWCHWARRRLPTEAEWEFAALHALPAGGVWEWTASPFLPYPGFAPQPYAEYSAPWFGDHRVLRGASWATSPRLAHPRFRNFYVPSRHDPFCGFRSCALER
jgi:iron(II)-dependent oxidoreductase